MPLNLIEILIGVASGIVIGSAFIALLTFLGIVPRLIQLSGSNHLVILYALPLIGGTLSGTYFTFSTTTYAFPNFISVLWGISQGIFIGMFAAALVEVLNVLPLLSRRIGLGNKVRILLMAVVFGKVFGSLFQWLYFTN